MMKVLVIVITKDFVKEECLKSILSQDYGDFSVVTSILKPIHMNDHAEKDRYQNIVRNRNHIKPMALASDAEIFLWVDSDTVLPQSAISSFVVQMQKGRKTTIPFQIPNGELIPAGTPVPDKKIMGGWYRVNGNGDYAAGKWVADNVFFKFRAVEQSLVKTDMIGFGCIAMDREVMEKIEFDAGTELYAKDFSSNQEVFLGEGLVFGNKATDLGYELFMNGDIVCEHLKS